MFTENKYYKWYLLIISNATDRIISNNYYENHHIIPTSLGGSKAKDNIVKLTAREHFICHLLLTKCLTGKNKSKMTFALHSMMHRKTKDMNRYIPNSRWFEYYRKINKINRKENMLGHTHSPATRKLISLAKTGKPGPNKGKKFSENHKQKISQSKMGKTLSIETRQKLSLSLKGHKSSETQKLAASKTARLILPLINKGSKRTVEAKAKMSKAMLGREITWGEKISKTRKERFIIPHNKFTKWKIISPSGEIIISDNLELFCLNNNIVFNTFRKCKDRGPLKRGPMIGWTCSPLNELLSLTE